MRKILIKKESIERNVEESIKEKITKEEIVETIIQNINEITKENNIDIKNVEYIGIAFPKSLRNNIIGEAVNLGVNGYEIKEELERILNRPVYMKNDAKCAAICEKKYGSLKEYENAVFLTIGTGIGGAVFINNMLLATSRNDLFKVGHITIQKDGIKCNCGKNGCFEKYASITALKEKVIKIYNLDREFTGINLHNFITKNLQDEKIEKIIEEYIENLSIGLANIINLFEPDVISIGGSFAYYEDIFLKKLEKKLKENATKFGESCPKILIAKYKNDAGIIGATLIL